MEPEIEDKINDKASYYPHSVPEKESYTKEDLIEAYREGATWVYNQFMW